VAAGRADRLTEEDEPQFAWKRAYRLSDAAAQICGAGRTTLTRTDTGKGGRAERRLHRKTNQVRKLVQVPKKDLDAKRKAKRSRQADARPASHRLQQPAFLASLEYPAGQT